MSYVRRKRAVNEIDEELVSVDSLKHVLCARCGCKEVSIRREEKDPPDFTVTIDGELFPTEVRSIVSNQQYSVHCEEFAKAVEAEGNRRKLLSGKYVLTVIDQPTIPKHTSLNGRRLIDEAVAYVSSTKHQQLSSEVELSKDESGKICLEKLSSIGSAVGLAGPLTAMWQGEAQDELARLIQNAVDVKKLKLQKVGIAPRKALLLLYDGFGYADAEDAEAALGEVNGHDWFHSVFWAASFTDRKNDIYPEEPGRQGLFLFSHDQRWQGAGRSRRNYT